jgi:hypothetical protein
VSLGAAAAAGGATADYEAMKAATGGRIAQIRAKIAILGPEADDQSATTTCPPWRWSAPRPPTG